MPLYLLKPGIDPATGYVYTPWDPWYDKTFGHVVRADNEAMARVLATNKAGDEGGSCWVDSRLSTCEEITDEGGSAVLLTDLRSA
jgi:hypothetical protein